MRRQHYDLRRTVSLSTQGQWPLRGAARAGDVLPRAREQDLIQKHDRVEHAELVYLGPVLSESVLPLGWRIAYGLFNVHVHTMTMEFGRITLR